MPYKVGYFVGSLSSTSINRILAKALIGVAPDELEFSEIPIRDLPLYSQDYDESYPPEAVALKHAIEESDAVLFVTPEYNRSIPGALKNAIDWVIGSGELERKVVAITASVPGAGRGRRGLAALAGTLGAVSARIVGGEPIVRGASFRDGVAVLIGALIAEAQRFMDGYADALRRGDPEEIVAHYDRDGVHEVRPASRRFTAHDALLARYRDRNTPAFFEWRDLSYEVLAPDKVLVVGLFAWAQSRADEPQLQSYVAVLRRQDGRLRVRLEAEAWQDGASGTTLAAVALVASLATLSALWMLSVLLRRRRRHPRQSRSSAT